MFTPRHDLVERVQELPETSQKHVFLMLRRKEIKYTENGNGVFFNLTQCEDPEVWEAMQRIVDQQSTMVRENQERENRIREMQQVLRGGHSEAPAAAAPVAPLPEPAPASAPAPVARRAGGRTAGGGGRTKPPTPRDILSLLAKDKEGKA